MMEMWTKTRDATLMNRSERLTWHGRILFVLCLPFLLLLMIYSFIRDGDKDLKEYAHFIPSTNKVYEDLSDTRLEIQGRIGQFKTGEPVFYGCE